MLSLTTLWLQEPGGLLRLAARTTSCPNVLVRGHHDCGNQKTVRAVRLSVQVGRILRLYASEIASRAGVQQDAGRD